MHGVWRDDTIALPVAFEKEPAGHATQTEAFFAPAAQPFESCLVGSLDTTEEKGD